MANAWRKLCAEAVLSNGGYSSGYHDRFPLSWNVALYHADLSLEHIHEVMCKEHGNLPLHPDLEWDENQQWEWGQSDMFDSLNDDDGNRTYSPDTAKRYGLPTGEDTIYFEVKFGLYGRSGKHLCVVEFDGRKLSDISARDLAEAIGVQDESHYYSNRWCRNLLAMIGEWDKIFTQANASAELEYQAAFRMHCELDELHTESTERRFWEERDVETVGA